MHVYTHTCVCICIHGEIPYKILSLPLLKSMEVFFYFNNIYQGIPGFISVKNIKNLISIGKSS